MGPRQTVYEQAGLGTELSYDLGLVGTAIAFLGVIVSWLYIAKWGRRTIWLTGSYALVACLFLIGIMACVNPQTKGLGIAESVMCIVWLGSYSMSVGPIVYTIVAEIGSTRLRTQTVVLGRAMYYFANLIGGILEPYFMSPTAWNAKGKTVSILFYLIFQFSFILFHLHQLIFSTFMSLIANLPCFARPSSGALCIS